MDTDFIDSGYVEQFITKFERTKEYIVEFAGLAKKEGVLALDGLISAAQNPDTRRDYRLLCDGVQLVIDGVENDDIDRWFDNVALFATNRMEEVYVELVRWGVEMINCGRSAIAVKAQINCFDSERQIL